MIEKIWCKNQKKVILSDRNSGWTVKIFMLEFIVNSFFFIQKIRIQNLVQKTIFTPNTAFGKIGFVNI